MCLHFFEEMKRCVLDHQMHGFEIGSHINDWNLDAPELEPVYKTAEELDVCLFVHPWDMDTMGGRHDKYWMKWLVGMPSETATAVCSVLMGGVLERHRRLRFCFAHGGGAYPQISARVAHGYNVRPDLCATQCKIHPSKFHDKIYCDSLVHDTNALQLLRTVVGDDRIVLGTDYPFPLGEIDNPGAVVSNSDHISETHKHKMLWANGMKMLNLDANKFI